MALTVKGSPITGSQAGYASQIVGIGKALGASTTAIEAVVVEAIAESTLGQNMAWNPTYGGLLAGNVGTFGGLGGPSSNAVTVAEINAAFKGGQGYVAGGAIGLAASSSDTLQIAMTNSGSGTQFLSESGNPRSWPAEAAAIVAAAGGGSLAGGTAGLGGTGLTPNVPTPAFQVGDTSNPDEDYFTAINRLAQGAQWYSFSDSETLYVADGTELIAQKPVRVIDLLGGDVLSADLTFDNTAYQYVSHHKVRGKVQRKATLAKITSPVEITLELICDIDEIRAGDVAWVVNSGPGDGRWLIGDCRRSVFNIFSELTLVTPLSPIKEAGQVGTSVPISALIPGGGGAVTASATTIPGHPEVRAAVASVFNTIKAQFPNLTITSTTGGGHAVGSYHYQGRAIDFVASNMDQIGTWIAQNLTPKLVEGIHNPTLAVKDGHSVDGPTFYAAVWAGHISHIHIAA